jgi:hypothetical protein
MDTMAAVVHARHQVEVIDVPVPRFSEPSDTRWRSS